MKAPKLRFKADDGNEFPEWTKVSFGSLIREYVDKTKEENENVLLSCAIEGVFLNSELFGHQRGESNVGYKKIQNNTLILSTQNLHLGNANVNRRFIHGIISPAYKTYHVVGCLPEFMAIWVKRPAAKRFFYEATTVGASQCRRNVVWDELYAQTLSLPSLPEQQKMAEFLSMIDEIIQSTKSELNAWQERKKGVMQKIFNREVRFKADDGSEFPEWEEKRLGDVFVERSERSADNLDLLSVTIANGVIRQNESDKRNVSSVDKSNYKRVYIGDLAYNFMRMWQGAEGVSAYDGIVSPAYTVLVPKKQEYVYFYEFMFKRTEMLHIFQRYSQGLTSDTWNLKYPALSHISVVVPSLLEQKKIAECLSSVDGVIRNIQAELSTWKEFKKGLLRQMFV